MVGTLDALLNGRHVQVVHSFNEEDSVGHDHSTDRMQYHHKGMSPHQYGHFVSILLMKTEDVTILKLIANLLFAAGHNIMINRDQTLSLVKIYFDEVIFASIIVTCDCTSSKTSLKDSHSSHHWPLFSNTCSCIFADFLPCASVAEIPFH